MYTQTGARMANLKEFLLTDVYVIQDNYKWMVNDSDFKMVYQNKFIQWYFDEWKVIAKGSVLEEIKPMKCI